MLYKPYVDKGRYVYVYTDCICNGKNARTQERW